MTITTIPALLEKGYTHWEDASVLSHLAWELNDRNRLTYATIFADRAIELAPRTCTGAYLAKFFILLRNLQSTERTIIDATRDILSQGYQWTGSGAIRAWSSMLLEDEQEAMTWMKEAESDTSPEAQIAIAGMLSWWRGKQDEGYNALLSFAHAHQPDDSLYWGDYCYFMLSQKSRGKDVDLEQDIIPRLRVLQHSYPDSIDFRRMLIRSYMAMAKAEDAMAECLEAIRYFPDDETLMFTLGNLYEKANEDTQALLWYHRAIGAKPSYVGARLSAAAIYERQQNLGIAEFLLREIPFVNPEVGYGAIELAYFLFRHNKQEEAISIFSEAWNRLYEGAKMRVAHHDIGKQLLERSDVASPIQG